MTATTIPARKSKFTRANLLADRPPGQYINANDRYLHLRIGVRSRSLSIYKTPPGKHASVRVTFLRDLNAKTFRPWAHCGGRQPRRSMTIWKTPHWKRDQ